MKFLRDTKTYLKRILSRSDFINARNMCEYILHTAERFHLNVIMELLRSINVQHSTRSSIDGIPPGYFSVNLKLHMNRGAISSLLAGRTPIHFKYRGAVSKKLSEYRSYRYFAIISLRHNLVFRKDACSSAANSACGIIEIEGNAVKRMQLICVYCLCQIFS